MALLASEFGAPLNGSWQAKLRRLDVDCYQSVDGAFRLDKHTPERILTDETRLAMEAWLKVRGSSPGQLFSEALGRCPRELSLGGNCGRFWASIPSTDDCQERVEREDELEGLLAELAINARALICCRMCDRGGNWSSQCLEKLWGRQPVDSAAPDPFKPLANLTKQQAQTAQEKINEARKRQEERREHHFHGPSA